MGVNEKGLQRLKNLANGDSERWVDYHGDLCSLINFYENSPKQSIDERGCVHCNPIKRRKILGDPMEGVTIKCKDSI